MARDTSFSQLDNAGAVLYRLPQTSGTAAQVLTRGTGTNTAWADAAGLTAFTTTVTGNGTATTFNVVHNRNTTIPFVAATIGNSSVSVDYTVVDANTITITPGLTLANGTVANLRII